MPSIGGHLTHKGNLASVGDAIPKNTGRLRPLSPLALYEEKNHDHANGGCA